MKNKFNYIIIPEYNLLTIFYYDFGFLDIELDDLDELIELLWKIKKRKGERMSIEKLKQEILGILRDTKKKVEEAEKKGEKKVKFAHISENNSKFSPIYCNGCGWIYLEMGNDKKSKYLPGIEYVIKDDKTGKVYLACSIQCLENIFKTEGLEKATVYTALAWIEHIEKGWVSGKTNE